MARLRLATANDSAGIAAVYLSAVHGSLPWIHLAHSDDEIRRWVSAHIVTSLDTWVAEVNGRAVAMMALRPTEGQPDRAWVDHLYVAPPHQRTGMGGRLLELAKERYPSGLQLITFQRNSRARAFYEHRDFIAAEFTDGAGNEENEPDVRYVWLPQDE